MAITRTDAPTLVDVAREADVSLKTASRVLNNAKNVSKDKSTRVREVIKRLGYRPNELARGLKAQRSAAIGMIVPNLYDPFIANAVNGLQEVARANGYVVILASSGGDADAERSEIRTLVGRQVDGLVIAPAQSRMDTFSDIIPAGVPLVIFDQLIRKVELDSVTVTNRRGAEEATEHLAGHGFRRILAIGAPQDLYTRSERLAGYETAMKQASLAPRICLLHHERSVAPDDLLKRILHDHDPDAIFTLNWACTMLVLRGLRQLGKIGGRDIPILSFGDFDLSEMLTPPLSVVRQPAQMLGREAARLLFERLKGSVGSSCAVVLPTSLVIRQSCGCSGSESDPAQDS